MVIFIQQILNKSKNAPAADGRPVPGEPIPRDLADELHCVAAWLDGESHRLRLEHCDGTLADPLARIPTFRAPPDPRT